MIQRLSQKISQKEELRVLATKGLHIEDYILDYHLVRNMQDVHGATYCLLRDWHTTQPDPKVSYTKLAQALRDVNMTLYVTEVLDT